MERKSHSHRLVFWGLAISLAIAFAGGIFIHRRFGRFTPLASAYVPPRSQLVVWLNVEQTVGFELFEKVILPALEVGRFGPEPRVKHLERKTSLELEVDTREFVFARIDERNWLVLLGGLFRRDKVLDGIGRWLNEVGLAPVREGQFLVAASGHTFGVTRDGVLLAASQLSVARQALSFAAPAEQRAILSKPGSLMNILVFPGSSGAAMFRLPAAARRLWVSIEPGDPFPIFAQVLGETPSGAGLQQVLASLPLRTETFQELAAPAGVRHFSGTVSPWAVDEAMTQLGRDFRSMIWGQP